MKIKELKKILRSQRGNIQFAIVYDSKTNTDVISGCSIEHAVETYGESELIRLEAFENQLILTI